MLTSVGHNRQAHAICRPFSVKGSCVSGSVRRMYAAGPLLLLGSDIWNTAYVQTETPGSTLRG